MCKFDVISNSAFGCVVKCKCCDHLHLGFGNMVVAFSSEEFSRYARYITNIHKKNYAELLISGEKIYLDTDSKKFVIALNPEELNELNQLLAEASLILEANKILNPENISD